MRHRKSEVNNHPSDCVPASEREHHVHLARYLALGMSIPDAARAAGVDRQTVYAALRATWFVERVNNLMKEQNADIMAMFRSNQLSALATLVEINDNPKALHKDRIAAAKEILDRSLGKAVQHVEVTPKPSSENVVEEVKILEEQVARLRENSISDPIIQLQKSA